MSNCQIAKLPNSQTAKLQKLAARTPEDTYLVSLHLLLPSLLPLYVTFSQPGTDLPHPSLPGPHKAGDPRLPHCVGRKQIWLLKLFSVVFEPVTAPCCGSL